MCSQYHSGGEWTTFQTSVPSKALCLLQMLLNQGLDLNRFSTSRGSIKKSSVGVDFPLQRLSLGDFASDKAGESSGEGRRSTVEGGRRVGASSRDWKWRDSDSAGSPTYQLYALCNHSGSVHYGHYTALCRCQTGWHVYNDSR